MEEKHFCPNGKKERPYPSILCSICYPGYERKEMINQEKIEIIRKVLELPEIRELRRFYVDFLDGKTDPSQLEKFDVLIIQSRENPEAILARLEKSSE